jgi:hypothetical protein
MIRQQPFVDCYPDDLLPQCVVLFTGPLDKELSSIVERKIREDRGIFMYCLMMDRKAALLSPECSVQPGGEY